MIDEKHIESAIMLSMLGDIIGFGNGIIEFNNKHIFDNSDIIGAGDYSLDIVFTFFNDGGFTNHPKKDWSISDDTVMSLCNANALIKHFSSGENLVNCAKREYIQLVCDKLRLAKFEKTYGGGLTTIKNLKKLSIGDDWELFEYDESAGGSGGSMRSAIFGVVFWKESDIIHLIESAMNTTRLTHPNAIAFMGSITVALFASYAMNNISINKWPHLMIEMFESKMFNNIIDKFDPKTVALCRRDKITFLSKWSEYCESRFLINTLEYKSSEYNKYPHARTKWYNNFSTKGIHIYPGAGGDDSTIIAYDCLVDSKGSWEKVVIYSMLHEGDSDTTGAICGFLYGLVYGTTEIANIMLNNIGDVEYVKQVKKICKNITKLVY